MSLMDQWHEEHKARLKRMGTAPRLVKQDPPPVPKQVVVRLTEPPMERVARALAQVRPSIPCKLDLIMGHGDAVPILGPPRLEDIMNMLAFKHNVTAHAIKSKSRVGWMTRIRQEFYYRAAKETEKSYPEIARYCGGRDHTTIMYGIAQHCFKNGLEHPRDKLSNTLAQRKARQAREHKQRTLRRQYQESLQELKAAHE